IAAEDIEHDVQVEIGPLGRPEELGDVPAPELVGPAGEQLRGGIEGMPELRAPLPHLGVRGQDAIHRPLGTQIPALVEQRGVDLAGCQVHEARRVQLLEHARAFRLAATCFCSSTSASARSARFCHRLISRACSASLLSRGSTTRRAGPRFVGAPASSPRSRAARHVVRCEEYSPSRRSNAPIAPGVLHPSASRTIFRLYSPVNCRRFALATTSIAGPAPMRSSLSDPDSPSTLNFRGSLSHPYWQRGLVAVLAFAPAF